MALAQADGRRVMVLGFSAQWAAPLPGRPFRYGGAVRPAPLANGVLRAMTAAIERLNAAVPLTGLASADFLVDGDAFHLLEVNPRPGASFDLFEHIAQIDRHVSEVARVLRPGGSYLFQTPNKYSNATYETLWTKSLQWRRYHPSLHSPGQLRRRLAKH
ncbi:MAG: ATP-grasp domain-containing protein, partial [Pseudolabrys sp.]